MGALAWFVAAAALCARDDVLDYASGAHRFENLSVAQVRLLTPVGLPCPIYTPFQVDALRVWNSVFQFTKTPSRSAPPNRRPLAESLETQGRLERANRRFSNGRFPPSAPGGDVDVMTHKLRYGFGNSGWGRCATADSGMGDVLAGPVAPEYQRRGNRYPPALSAARPRWARSLVILDGFTKHWSSLAAKHSSVLNEGRCR